MNEETLFELAVNANESARAELLDEHCVNNPELRQRIERLLRAHDARQTAAIEPTVLHEIMADDSGGSAKTSSNKAANYEAGTVLGEKYLLRELIAEGGMGAVWLATQTLPVKRKVAIKLIKAGMDSRQVIARFEAERQALAMMDHPNIAKVFDGGMTPQSRPYFVMEYVKGIPLTDYCDQERLAVADRLRLFMPVCQAVQHAHQKGIVHRDLKPSNILVCLYDGKPVVKVIDFGLAKAMHQPLTEHSVFTSHGVMVGTPLYMSPEQAEYNNLDVDTRTDIYSLGVVLYELLTGTTPLEREQLRAAAYNEVLRLIKEVEPLRPSTRLSQSASLPSIASQRRIDPKQLSRSLAGDLDWIVMKSLEKERSRRYESAVGLARDVERYLNEEVIEARPPSLSYKWSKYFKKHKLQAAAITAVAIAMLSGTTVATWGWLKASEAEDKVRASLAEVTAERDAKNEALSAVEAQREVAELALIEGLLRPIGFGGEAEVKAFKDWSEIDEDRLKLRIFEVGMEQPDTAFRMSNSSYEVLRACVGISLTRRAKVLEILDSTLNNSKENPNGIDAAMNFKLNLGGVDDELVNLTIESLRSNRTQKGFMESLVMQLVHQESRINQSQAERICEACIMATTFPSFLELREPTAVLFDAMSRLASDAEIRNYSMRLVQAITDDSNEAAVKIWAANRFNSIDARLADDQLDHRWDALLTAIDSNGGFRQLSEYSYRPVEQHGTVSSIVSLIPKATDDQILAFFKVLVQITRNGEPPNECLVAVAPRLSNEQAQTIWDSICTAMESGKTDNHWSAGIPESSYIYFKCLIALLSEEQIKANYLRANVINEAQSEYHRALKQDLLAALLPHLPREYQEQAWDHAVSAIIKNKDFEDENHRLNPISFPGVLAEIATNASAAQIQDAWEELLNEETSSSLIFSEKHQIPESLEVLVKFMTAEQVQQACNMLFSDSPTGDDKNNPTYANPRAIVALCSRMPDSKIWNAWELLVSRIIEKEESYLSESQMDYAFMPNPDEFVARAVHCLVERMPSKWSIELQKELLILLSESRSSEQKLFVLLLMQNASKSLPDALVDLYYEVAIKTYDARTDGWDYDAGCAEAILRNLIPQLSLQQVEHLMDRFIQRDDRRQFMGFPFTLLLQSISPKRRVDLAKSIFAKFCESEQRLLNAKEDSFLVDKECLVLSKEIVDPKFAVFLMTQQNFAHHQADILLQRFEELVLFDGRNVLLETNDDATGPADKSKPAKPNRQFLTIWDAAKWIEKNWPNYDLDAVPNLSSEQAGG